MEIECNSWAEADRWAEAALGAFPAGSPGLICLAQDVAYRWVEQGRHWPALLVMEELLAVYPCPSDRQVILGHVARAAAGVGDCDTFERAWAKVWAGLSDAGDVPGSARALLGLAHGAANLSEWSRAERAVTRAINLATLRGERNVSEEAEKLLEAIRARVDRASDGDPSAGERAENLATQLVTALRESRDGAVST